MNPFSSSAPRLTWLSAAFVVAFAALVGSIGADAHWLAALGREIAELGSVPDGVPFAAAPSADWVNVPVLGELAFHGLESAFGDRGLVLAQVVAVALCLGLLIVDMRRAGAADAPAALVLLLAAVAASSSLLVVRGQLFSLALFPLLLVILRRQTRLPTDAIWLVVPLFALWANLHGAVLTGIAVAGAYLLLNRMRREPLVSTCVLALSIATLLATPALLGASDYYRGVLGSEAVAGREGMWAPLSLDKPLDLAFLVAGVPLVLAALASRPRLWEFVALAGLAAMTFQSGRNAVWLVIFAATPAATWLTGSRAWEIRPSRAITGVVAALLAAFVALGFARQPVESSAGYELRAAAAKASHGRPILADDLNAEALALDGRRVWISNPLDAFDHIQQRAYLDWIAGRPAGDVLLAQFTSALVLKDSPPALRLAEREGWRVAGRDERAVLYVRADS